MELPDEGMLPIVEASLWLEMGKEASGGSVERAGIVMCTVLEAAGALRVLVCAVATIPPPTLCESARSLDLQRGDPINHPNAPSIAQGKARLGPCLPPSVIA